MISGNAPFFKGHKETLGEALHTQESHPEAFERLIEEFRKEQNTGTEESFRDESRELSEVEGRMKVRDSQVCFFHKDGLFFLGC